MKVAPSLISLPPGAPMGEAMRVLEEFAQGIVLVVGEDRRLVGTISDGDIRRAILAGLAMDAQLQELLDHKRNTPYEIPVTASIGTDHEQLRELMRQKSVRQIPLLGQSGDVLELVTWEELIETDRETTIQAVIMAGGEGRRLRPLTNDLPKPMLPVGDRPILEHVVERLREAGITTVCITTRYKAELIKKHFGDGARFGVQMDYITEEKPLGTAGALADVSPGEGPVLVVNGDVLTNLDFRQLLDFHQTHEAALTMAVRRYEVAIPYGVVECEGIEVRGIGEKPTLGFLVNAGIYLLERGTVAVIPRDERFDMIDLVQALIRQGKRVAAFPIHEYWVDVGEHDKYHQAQSDAEEGRFGR